LVSAIYEKGPISVAIDASHKSFSFYSHGVYYEPECGMFKYQSMYCVIVQCLLVVCILAKVLVIGKWESEASYSHLQVIPLMTWTTKCWLLDMVYMILSKSRSIG